MEGASDTRSMRSLDAGGDAPRPSGGLGAVHRRLWSWRWSSSADSAMDQARREQGGASSPAPSPRAEEAVAWSGGFPAVRGGVAVFTLAVRRGFTIAVGCADDMDGAREPSGQTTAARLGVRVGGNTAELILHSAGGCGARVLQSVSGCDVGFGDGSPAAFWLSFDPYNRTVKYGKGSRIRDRTFLSHAFTSKACKGLSADDCDAIDRLFSPLAKLVELQRYSGPPIVEHSAFDTPLLEQRQQSGLVTFDEEPLLSDPSPRLLDSAQMMLHDFARRDYSLPAHLPPAAQSLAQQVMQPWLSLDAATEEGRPCLVDAIQHSLATPGAFLHTLLKEKIAALPAGVPAHASQLSVALAPADGTAPGPAFSLELLPRGHCSLPHDNARAHGVLRVLHGYMEVALFDANLEAADPDQPLDEVELDQGDAMWFSPTLYQTHAMRNDEDAFCCYLLARRYADDDCVRWPYIRTQEREGEVVSSHAAADCTFQQLQETVTAELEQALASNPRLLEPKQAGESSDAHATVKAWVERADSAFEEELPITEPMHIGSKALRYSCISLAAPWRKCSEPAETVELPESALTPKAVKFATEPVASHNLAFMWP